MWFLFSIKSFMRPFYLVSSCTLDADAMRVHSLFTWLTFCNIFKTYVWMLKLPDYDTSNFDLFNDKSKNAIGIDRIWTPGGSMTC